MDRDYLEQLLMDLDAELGSSIAYADNKEVALNSMTNASIILDRIKEVLEIEF